MKVKSNERNKLVALLSIAMVSTFSCGLVMMNSLDKGFENQVAYAADLPEGAVFEVDNEASVRLNPDAKGIKFNTTMTNEYYSWLKETYPNATSFTLQVEANRYENPLEADAMKDTFALTEDVFKNTDNEPIDLDYSWTVSYDNLNLSAEKLQEAYALVLKAEASVIVSQSGVDDVVIPAEGRCVRNMTAVAKYLVDNNLYKTEEDKNTLQKYYNTDAAQAITTPAAIDFLHGYTDPSTEETVDALTFENAIDENYSLYINAIPLTRKTNTKFEISEELRSQLEYDKDYTVYAFDADNKSTTFTVHTYAGIIYTEQDFKDVFAFSTENLAKYAKENVGTNVATYYTDAERDFTGNYLLANDITMSEMGHTGMDAFFQDLNTAGGMFQNVDENLLAKFPSLANLFFSGTFDGQGHKITATLAGAGCNTGLFGKLRDGALIKNLSMHITATGSGNYMLTRDNLGGVPVFDNCYLLLDETARYGNSDTRPNHRISDYSISFKNSVIDYAGVSYIESSAYRLFGRQLHANLVYENTVLLGDNRPFVGANEDKKPYYASNDGQTDFLAGTYRFDDYNDFAEQAATLPGLQFTGFNPTYWAVLSGVPVFVQNDVPINFALEAYRAGGTLKLETTDTLDISASYFGLPVEVSVSAGTATNVSIADNTLTALTAGTGTLAVSYTFAGENVSYSVPYEVVIKPIDRTETLYYSAVDGLLYGFPKYVGEITVTSGETEITLEPSDKVVDGYTVNVVEDLTVADTTVKGQIELVVTTANSIERFKNVVTVAKIIANADDWTYLNIGAADTTTKDGYVLVLKDLDTTSMINLHTMTNNKARLWGDNNNTAWKYALGLRGTFDGNGKTIKVKSSKVGIFGAIVGLTIKDVCFVVDATSEILANEDNANNQSALNVILATGIKESTLENVVIKLNSTTGITTGTGANLTLFNFIQASTVSTLRNVIVDYGSYAMDTTKAGGLLSVTSAGLSGYLDKSSNLKNYNKVKIDNVNIIYNGAYKLTTSTSQYGSTTDFDAYTETVSGAYYASNEADESVAEGTAGKTVTTVYRYDNAEALATANTYSTDTTKKWICVDDVWTFSDAE